MEIVENWDTFVKKNCRNWKNLVFFDVCLRRFSSRFCRDWCRRFCKRVGVVGFHDKNPGEASGGRGGKGEEYNDQHGRQVWRFEAVEGNGGIGVDSSEEKLGLEDIDRSGIGGVDGLEDRILS